MVSIVDHTDEINSPYALIPIIAYCYHKAEQAPGAGHLTDLEIRKIVKWFYYSQIRTRYISQLPQKLDRDLRMVQESEQPFDELLRVIQDERALEILPDEFEGRTTSHPLYPMMRWYFNGRVPVSLARR